MTTTKTILLALALTLGAASAAPPAFACGGYAFSQEQTDRWSAHAALRAFLARQRGSETEVVELELDGDRARGRVRVTTRRGTVERVAHLRRHEGTWRVVRVA